VWLKVVCRWWLWTNGRRAAWTPWPLIQICCGPSLFRELLAGSSMGYLRQQEIRMTVRPVVWVGIDAGKAAHHAAVIDEQGRLCWSQKVPNDQAAIEQLVARAAATATEVRRHRRQPGRLRHVWHLAASAGLVPEDSGRISGNLRRPQRDHRRLRHVFYMAAFSSIKTAGPSRTFYQRKRGERRIHTQALLALARRLADVLWALLRDDRLFTTAPPPAARAA
jgi:hypothetical protein